MGCENAWQGTPCGTCGAAAGEPCDPDCAHLNAYLETNDLPDTPTSYSTDLANQARVALRKVACRLPYAGLMDDPPNLQIFEGHDPQFDDIWLAKMAVWLEEYRVLLAAKVEELQDGNRKAIGLQLEKDMVRHFLGVTG